LEHKHVPLPLLNTACTKRAAQQISKLNRERGRREKEWSIWYLSMEMGGKKMND